MRLGVMILPEKPWRNNADRWRTVESLGYDSAWTYDHLWWRSLSDGAWFSAVPVLSAAAAVTRRIMLGIMVASPNFRHPAVLAKDTVTIDDISGGRFILGLGAGSPGAGDAMVIDRTALSPRERADRFNEFVELTDRLLRQPVTSYSGRFYALDDARMLPVHEPRVPVAIAASGPRGMALVARYADIWVTMGPTNWSRDYRPGECRSIVAGQTAMLNRACDEAGRDMADLERLFITTGWAGDPLKTAGTCLDMAEQYAEVGITHLIVHWPRESGVYAGDPTMLHEVAAEVLPAIHQL